MFSLFLPQSRRQQLSFSSFILRFFFFSFFFSGYFFPSNSISIRSWIIFYLFSNNFVTHSIFNIALSHLGNFASPTPSFKSNKSFIEYVVMAREEENYWSPALKNPLYPNHIHFRCAIYFLRSCFFHSHLFLLSFSLSSFLLLLIFKKNYLACFRSSSFFFLSSFSFVFSLFFPLLIQQSYSINFFSLPYVLYSTSILFSSA